MREHFDAYAKILVNTSAGMRVWLASLKYTSAPVKEKQNALHLSPIRKIGWPMVSPTQMSASLNKFVLSLELSEFLGIENVLRIILFFLHFIFHTVEVFTH